ncbi:MAG: hypothetical protein ABI442_03065 [Gemmatimonadaceae bacterium]
MWLLLVGATVGQAFQTPFPLGRGLLGAIGIEPTGKRLVVAVYTVFHYAAFVVAATLAARVIHWSEKTPSVLAGAFTFFVAVAAGRERRKRPITRLSYARAMTASRSRRVAS